MPILFSDIHAFGTLTELGLVFLGIVAIIDCLREGFKLLVRKPSNFAGVAWRTGAAAVTITCIPWLASTIAEVVLAIANYLLKEAAIDGLQRSLEMAVTGGGACPDANWTDYIVAVFTPAGWIWLMAPFLMMGAVFLKLLVVDVAWPVFFSLEVYFGLLSIPLTFLQGDGLRSFAQRVLSVAVWPIVYAFILVLVAATFKQTIKEASAGSFMQRRCAATVEATPTDDGHAESGIGSIGENAAQNIMALGEQVWALVRYLVVVLMFMLLTWKVPQLSGRLVGVPDPPGLWGMAAGIAKTVATKGVVK